MFGATITITIITIIVFYRWTVVGEPRALPRCECNIVREQSNEFQCIAMCQSPPMQSSLGGRLWCWGWCWGGGQGCLLKVMLNLIGMTIKKLSAFYFLSREDIDFLLEKTSFDEYDIREWFRAFIKVILWQWWWNKYITKVKAGCEYDCDDDDAVDQDCPSGSLSKAKATRIYSLMGMNNIEQIINSLFHIFDRCPMKVKVVAPTPKWLLTFQFLVKSCVRAAFAN